MSAISSFAIGQSVLNISHRETDVTIDSVFHEIFEQKVYESPRCRIMPGDTVVDGGAHFGLFALYAALAGASEIICFEPDPRTSVDLAWNLSKGLTALDLHPHVQYFNQALWDGESIIEFRPAKQQSAGSHVVLPGLSKRAGDVFVETMALDSLDLRKVDVVKLDIEGCELQALLGMQKTIKRCRPKLMVSVYHHSQDAVRIPNLIKSYGMGYKQEVSNAGGKHITAFFY